MSGLNKSGVPGGILFTFVFLLFCISSNNIGAQSLQPSISAEAYDWKSAEEATSLLHGQIEVLTQQLPGMAEGTPMYDNTLRRIAFFKAIMVEIGRGSTVAQSLDLSLPAAATLGFSKEASYTPKITLRAIHTETRILLTN